MYFHLSHCVSYCTPIADRIFEPADHTWLQCLWLQSVSLMQVQLWQRSVPELFCWANQGGQAVVSIAGRCVCWSFISVVENTSITIVRRTIIAFIFCWVVSRLPKWCMSNQVEDAECINTKTVIQQQLLHFILLWNVKCTFYTHYCWYNIISIPKQIGRTNKVVIVATFVGSLSSTFWLTLYVHGHFCLWGSQSWTSLPEVANLCSY